MQINFVYNSSVDLAPTGFKVALTAAAQYLDGLIANVITVTVQVGWGEDNGAPITGDIATGGPAAGIFDPYDLLKSNLIANATSVTDETVIANLPATDPTGGGLFFVSNAQARAWGLIPATSSEVDGTIGFGTTIDFNYDPQNRAVSGEIDFVGVAEHELSHVLGRVAGLQYAPNLYTPLDLFRYSAPGTFQLAGGQPGYFSIDGGTTHLNPFDTVFDYGDWASTVQNNSFGYASVGTVNSVTPTDITVLDALGFAIAICFCTGTQIATPHGERAVEELAVGNSVLTHSGRVAPITWIGSGKILTTRGRRNAATPITVRKGALADNVPNRHLRVTKGHSLYLDDVLIPVEFLVNHRSIVWDDRAQEVEIYHIELATHDILLANGAPAESYRDDGNRWLFQNANSGWHHPAKPPCAPVLTGGRLVDEIWRRLLERSGPSPGLPLTNEPDLHLLVDGQRLDCVSCHGEAHVFRLPGHVETVRIVSRAAAPSELGLARDPRLLGVAIRAIVLLQGRRYRIIEAQGEELVDGFHMFEDNNGFRWSDGDALVPSTLFDGIAGTSDLVLLVASTAKYALLDSDQVRAAG